MGKSGDGAKGEIRAAICPFCKKDWDKDHEEKENDNCPNGNSCGRDAACGWGNIGIGTVLAKRIKDASGCEKAAHPMAYKGGNLQAHHLVCSEALNDKKGEWARVCHLAGYNINCYKNGVFLPSELEQACGARVPLHKGGHGAGYGGDADTNYPDAVIEKVASVLDDYRDTDVCQDPEKLKELVTDLNTKSKEIFGKVKSFAWTITWDGFDYQQGNPIGCSNQDTVSDKRGTRTEKGEDGKQKKVQYSEDESKAQKLLLARRNERIEVIEKEREDLIDLFKKLRDDQTIICNCKRTHSVRPYKLIIGR